MQEDEILKLAQQGKTPFQIAEELMGDEDRVYLNTPVSWYVDPTVDEEALDKPPLSIEMNYYSQCQSDAGCNGYANEERRILNQLKKCWRKSFQKYHGTKVDIH